MTHPASMTQRVGNRLTLIGTIHVDPASVLLVEETIRTLRPEVVALELDEARLHSLQNPGRGRASLATGASFLVMMLLEKFAGQLTGSPPGMEMVRAIRAAGSVGARIELVDLPIETTVQSLRKLPLREKLRIAVDSVASLAVLPFGRLDMSAISEHVEGQLQLFRSRYPLTSKLLLDDREQYMSERIQGILDMSQGPVVAVIGFGHMGALSESLSRYTGRMGHHTSFTWKLNTNS